MSNLYNRLSSLCEEKGITGYRMCRDLSIQPSVMTDLKKGRRSGLKAETANKIAEYFGVTVGYLLGETEQKEKPDGLQTTIRPEEMRLIDQFRKLSPEMQEFIISSVESQAEKLKKAQKK